MGDTQTVIQALQSLQEKVRLLEEERNFHRRQCQDAHDKHESFKQSVEVQLRQERADHRRREEELQHIVDAMAADKKVLEDASVQNRSQMQRFRDELSLVMARERDTADIRERDLRNEVEVLRAETIDLRSYHEKLSQTIGQLKGERELILATNRRLEKTITELVTLNDTLGSRKGPSLPAQFLRAVSPGVGNSMCLRLERRMKSERAAANALHTSYCDPTISSIARGISSDRGVRGEVLPDSANVPRSRSRRRVVSIPQSDLYEEALREHQRLVDSYAHMLSLDAYNQNEVDELVSQIDLKAEQLRLMRLSHLSSDRASVPRSGGAPRGTGKVAQRGALVAQIRNML